MKQKAPALPIANHARKENAEYEVLSHNLCISYGEKLSWDNNADHDMAYIRMVKAQPRTTHLETQTP